MNFSKKQKPMARDVRRDYFSQLQHPEWLCLSRNLIDERGACAFCGEKESLQVHHKVYRPYRDAWEYADWELEVLCRSCHETIHRIADDCWIEMLSMNPTQLELILKAFKFINQKQPEQITGSVVDFLRTCKTSHQNAESFTPPTASAQDLMSK